MSIPLLYESHSHTPLCKHAVGMPGDYAAVAEARGLKGLILTCHNPIPCGYSAAVRMDISEFDTYCRMVEEARQTWAGRVDVRLGLECDFAPGMEPWLRDLLARAEFHYVLGSIHPQIPEYRAKYDTGDSLAYQKIYFEHLALAAESGLFDALAHPDLIKNMTDWNLDRIFPHIEAALDRIAAAGTALELNTSGRQKRLSEINPGPEILRAALARRIPVVLGADAHEPARAGDYYPEALELLQQLGFGTISFFLDRHRQDVPVGVARNSFDFSCVPARNTP